VDPDASTTDRERLTIKVPKSHDFDVVRFRIEAGHHGYK
jgi:hypothetical protein